MQNILAFGPGGSAAPLLPIARALTEQGYTVAHADLEGSNAAEELSALFAGRPPDFVLADLSGTPGILPLHHLRRLLTMVWSGLPVRPCLALFTPQILALPDWPAFADDFLLPPFSSAEAVARIRLLSFRRQGAMQDTLRLADIVLDLSGHVAREAAPGGRSLALTPREWDLLHFLAMHRGRFFSRERLLDFVWGVDYDGGERTVDIHMRRLRAKLPAGASACLQTRRGGGYGLAAD